MADFFNNYGGGYGRYGGGMGAAVGQAVGAMTGDPGMQPNNPGDQIAQMYARVSGGTYTPTQQDIAQFGANPDATYLQKIAPQIQQWWNQNKASNPTGAQPGGDVYGPSAAYQSQMGQAAGQMGQVAQQAFTPLSQLARGYGGYGGGMMQTQQQHQLPDGSWVSPNQWAQQGGYRPPQSYGGNVAGLLPNGAPGGGYGQPPGGAGGGTVLLRAPNGQTQAVPADHVQYYLARGATRG